MTFKNGEKGSVEDALKVIGVLDTELMLRSLGTDPYSSFVKLGEMTEARVKGLEREANILQVATTGIEGKERVWDLFKLFREEVDGNTDLYVPIIKDAAAATTRLEQVIDAQEEGILTKSALITIYEYWLADYTAKMEVKIKELEKLDKKMVELRAKEVKIAKWMDGLKKRRQEMLTDIDSLLLEQEQEELLEKKVAERALELVAVKKQPEVVRKVVVKEEKAVEKPTVAENGENGSDDGTPDGVVIG